MTTCFCGHKALVLILLPNKKGERAEKGLCQAHLNYSSLLRGLKSKSRITAVMTGNFDVIPPAFKPLVVPFFTLKEGEEYRATFQIDAKTFSVRLICYGSITKIIFKGLDQKTSYEIFIGNKKFELPPFEIEIPSPVSKPILLKPKSASYFVYIE